MYKRSTAIDGGFSIMGMWADSSFLPCSNVVHVDMGSLPEWQRSSHWAQARFLGYLFIGITSAVQYRDAQYAFPGTQ